MALEIKSIDVENEAEDFYINLFQNFGWRLKSSQRVFNQTARPVWAISYENLTYVHSETETVDFTKLVFERDKKMPNYRELIDLEAEFWELSDNLSLGRPYMPPNVNTMEDWGKHFEPDLRSKKEKVKIHVKHVLLLAIVALLPVLLLNALNNIPYNDSYEGIITAISFWSIFAPIAVVLMWRIKVVRSKKHALKVACKPKSSSYRTALEGLYEVATSQIKLYDESQTRMNNILVEAADLLDI